MTSLEQIRAAIGKATAAHDALEKLRAQERDLEAERGPALQKVQEAEPALDQALASQRLDGGSAAETKRANEALSVAQLALREVTASLSVVRERIAAAETEAKALSMQTDRLARDIGEQYAPLLLERARAAAAALGDALHPWYWLSGQPIGQNQMLAHDLGRVLFEHKVSCVEGSVVTGNQGGYDLPPGAAKVLEILERSGIRERAVEPEAKAAE